VSHGTAPPSNRAAGRLIFCWTSALVKDCMYDTTNFIAYA
jgi:hypothetical protein